MLRHHADKLEKVVAAYTSKVDKMRPIHPEYVAALLDEAIDDDAIVTVDTGMCNVWAARYLTPTGRRRIIGSFRHGTMANALPHAIGAAYAEPGRQVVSMSGDGGLTMLLGELLTVAEHNLPIKVVAFNNGSLGMIRLEMMVAGYPSFQTDHGVADLAGVATRLRRPGDHRRRPGRAAQGAATPRCTPPVRTCSTSAPTPTRCPSRRTSPPARYAASPSPPPAPCSTAASAR